MQFHSLQDITRQSRHIFLSPHLDDAVYSCGGTLAVQVSDGIRPLVVTIFGDVPPANVEVSPLAGQIDREMASGQDIDATTLVEKRRQEDVNALNFLQVDFLWLNYLDAIYRGTPAYYTDKQQLIGGEVNPADQWIDKQLAQDLAALHERLPDTFWYAPLAIAHHVDHQIVASAADRLIQLGANVCLYEDFPYVLQSGALEARLKQLGGALEPLYVEMSEMLPLRIEASEMYTTQVAVNFGSRAALRNSMESYTHNIRPVETVHLERYWKPA